MKVLLVRIIIAILMPVLGASSAQAPTPDMGIASAAASPYLGNDIIISALNNQQVMPAVAYNPRHDEYLVVWQNNWPSSDIYAQRISGKGEKLSWFAVAPTAPLNPYPNDRISPSVAYDPNQDRYLVVWLYDTAGNGSNWDVHGIFVNWNGPIQGLHQLNICDWTTQQDMPKVAYSSFENEFMIVWMTTHPSIPAYISGRRMRASDGTFISVGSDFTISNGSEARVRPEIAYHDYRKEYLVVYDNTHDIFAMRFNSEGTAQGGEFGIATWSGDETEPSVAYCWQGDQYLVAWQNNQPDIYAWMIKGDGTKVGNPLHLDYTSVTEAHPLIACNNSGNQFLVVWQQQFSSLSGPSGIWGQFVNANNTLGESFGIMAPTSGVQANFTTPAVTGGNVSYLAVWEHDRAGTSYQDINGVIITSHILFLPMVQRNH